jgi:hypothetical protein
MCSCNQSAGDGETLSPAALLIARIKERIMEIESTMVPLNLSKDVELPLNLMIPGRLVAETGFPRRFTVKQHDEKVPQAVRDWLKADSRYAKLFAPDEPGKSPADKKPAGGNRTPAAQPDTQAEPKNEPPAQ